MRGKELAIKRQVKAKWLILWRKKNFRNVNNNLLDENHEIKERIEGKGKI